MNPSNNNNLTNMNLSNNNLPSNWNQNRNPSSNFERHRFAIPPPTTSTTGQGPFYLQYYPSQLLAPRFTFPPATHSTSTTLYFPTSTPRGSSSTLSNTPSSSDPASTDASISAKGGRGKNWIDAETRYLLDIWRDSYPISKRRNSAAWDAIATKLNKTLSEQGMTSFRSGQQCKGRIKHLEDDYNRVKDHNNRSGNDRDDSFEYYEELEGVLGCKPNITPRLIVNCGLDETDESPLETENDDDDYADDLGDEKDDAAANESPRQGKRAGKDDDAAANESPRQGKRAGKGKQPASRTPASKTPSKKAKKAPSQCDSELYDFLKTSQEKDHAFFAQLAEKESEREERSQKLMFDTVKEIAKIFKGDK